MATVVASRNCSLTTSALRLSSRTLAISSKGLNHNATRRTLQRSITLGRPTSVFQQEQSLPSLSNAPTTRTASTSANSSTTPTPTASPSNQATLTWDEFLKLRRTRRYVNLGASLFSGVGAIAVATPLIAEYEIENVGAQMTGLDPMFVIGGSLMAVGGVGWLMGPFLGTAFFKVWKSSVASEFARVWSTAAVAMNSFGLTLT